MRTYTNNLFETGKTIIPKTMKSLGNKKNKNDLGLLKIYLKYKLLSILTKNINKNV